MPSNSRNGWWKKCPDHRSHVADRTIPKKIVRFTLFSLSEKKLLAWSAEFALWERQKSRQYRFCPFTSQETDDLRGRLIVNLKSQSGQTPRGLCTSLSKTTGGGPFGSPSLSLLAERPLQLHQIRSPAAAVRFSYALLRSGANPTSCCADQCWDGAELAGSVKQVSKPCWHPIINC